MSMKTSFSKISMASFELITGDSMRKGLRGIITLFLVVLHLANLKSHEVEAKKMDQIEDDLVLERQLKILNKHPLKTIMTKEGDILDCVDFYKQPAFDHPLLKDHKIQRKPTFFPKGEENKTSSEYLQISLKLEKCPKGTVPIRRTSKEDLLRARALSRDISAINFNQSKKHFPGQFITDVNIAERGLIHGASAQINVYNPKVEASQFTNAQIWINGGPNENPNHIMAGWTVNPSLYGDHITRLFTFWTGDGYRNGCYNTLCKGFVQVDRSIVPSMDISPISTIGGPQYQIKVNIFQDRNTGNWWLSISDNKVHVGYWPKSLFSYLTDGANSVSWGGLAQAGSDGVSPPMGSGLFPKDYYSCFFRWLKYVDHDYYFRNPTGFERIRTRVDGKNCYDILYHEDELYSRVGASITFGGPGGHCA